MDLLLRVGVEMTGLLNGSVSGDRTTVESPERGVCMVQS